MTSPLVIKPQFQIRSLSKFGQLGIRSSITWDKMGARPRKQFLSALGAKVWRLHGFRAVTTVTVPTTDDYVEDQQPSPHAFSARSFLDSTMSCDVTERYSPALSQTSRGQRIKRERLGTRLGDQNDVQDLRSSLKVISVRVIYVYFAGVSIFSFYFQQHVNIGISICNIRGGNSDIVI